MKKFLYLFVTLFVFVFALSSCNKNNNEVVDDYVITATAPNGAPAVALATLAKDHKENFNFINAKTIGTAFSNDGSDVVIAPINAGANLYAKKKSTYKLAAVITWGNLYFASKIENFTLDTINGKEITLFGESTINSSVALYVLEKNNIVPSKVNYVAEATDTQAILAGNDANAIVMCAEPAISATKMKNSNIQSISIQQLYKEKSGNDEFAQAGIFVKDETIKNHEKVLSNFLKQLKEETDKLTENLDKFAEASVELGILPALPVAKAAIPNCSIRFKDAKEAKSAIEKTANLNLAQYGGELPSEDFYYSAF